VKLRTNMVIFRKAPPTNEKPGSSPGLMDAGFYPCRWIMRLGSNPDPATWMNDLSPSSNTQNQYQGAESVNNVEPWPDVQKRMGSAPADL